VKKAIVTTTINIPTFIESYIKHFQKSPVSIKDLNFIIIGDLKSPDKEIHAYLSKLNPEFNVEYWDVVAQRKWIRETYKGREDLVDFVIPYNSIRRRNLGYLRALELGADVIITIDDDNYINESSWFTDHLNSLNYEGPLPTVSSRNNIVNPCRILKFTLPYEIYSRGYPLPEFFQDSFDVIMDQGRKTVLNMGLWRENPDVDSYTNLLYPGIKSLGIEGHELSYALAFNNYMPINTQNTAFVREITPAYYCVLMDTKLLGINIDRYDDIWGGLFVLKLIHRMKHRITFGKPLTLHIRNTHDYLRDFKSEFLGVTLNYKIYKILMNDIEIESNNYIDGYAELANKLLKNIEKKFNNSEILKYFRKLTEAMNGWVRLVTTFL
jgi:hypothetical protein